MQALADILELTLIAAVVVGLVTLFTLLYRLIVVMAGA